MKMTVFAGLALTLLLVGCNEQEIATPNGEIPSAFASYASAYEGSYQGTMSSGDDGLLVPGTHDPLYTSGTITLKMNGLKPEITFLREDGDGSDVFVPKCGSSIGDLQSIIVSKEKLKSLVFGFNPNNCGDIAQGRTLDIDVATRDGRPQLYASIFLYQYQELPDMGPGDIVSTNGSVDNITWNGTFSPSK